MKEGELKVEKEIEKKKQEVKASQFRTPRIGGKIIKRYQNRKLYDTQQSCYVTLDDIAKMIRSEDENVIVIDNKTKKDITAATLTQIIFETEKREGKYAPLYTLKEIIQYKNGSISRFLEKLGVFPDESREKEQIIFRRDYFPEIKRRVSKSRLRHEEVEQTLEERVARAAVLKSSKSFSEDLESEGPPPDLPNPNQSLTN